MIRALESPPDSAFSGPALSFAEWSLWLAPPKENPCDDIREKIFKNHALKSIDAVRAKPEEAILSLERKPEIVKSIPSFPYILKSL
jgi:hypothetical protein